MRSGLPALLSFLLLLLLAPPALAQLSGAGSNLDPCPGCAGTYITTSTEGSVITATLYRQSIIYRLTPEELDRLYQCIQTECAKPAPRTPPAPPDQCAESLAGISDLDLKCQAFHSGGNAELSKEFDKDAGPHADRVVSFYILQSAWNDANHNSIRDPGEVTTTRTYLTERRTDAAGQAVIDTNDPGIKPSIDSARPAAGCITLEAEYDAAYSSSTIGRPTDATKERGSTAQAALCTSFLLPLQNINTGACLSIFVLLALLAGGMYAAGRNPVGLFDISVPRLPRPKPYGMRRVSVGTAGALQRIALIHQQRKAQDLSAQALDKIAKDLKEKHGIAMAEDVLRARRAGRIDEFAAGALLRMLASSAVRNAGELHRRIAELEQRYNGVKGLGWRDGQREEFRRDMRDIMEGRNLAYRGRGALVSGAGGLNLQARFRVLHDSLWEYEVARAVRQATDKAYGTSPRTVWLANMGFVGTVIRTAGFGRLAMGAALLRSVLTKGVPALLGAESDAAVGKVKNVGAEKMDEAYRLYKDLMESRLARISRMQGEGHYKEIAQAALAGLRKSIDGIDKENISSDAKLRRLMRLADENAEIFLKKGGLWRREFWDAAQDAGLKFKLWEISMFAFEHGSFKDEGEMKKQLDRFSELLKARRQGEIEKEISGLFVGIGGRIPKSGTAYEVMCKRISTLLGMDKDRVPGLLQGKTVQGLLDMIRANSVKGSKNLAFGQQLGTFDKNKGEFGEFEKEYRVKSEHSLKELWELYHQRDPKGAQALLEQYREHGLESPAQLNIIGRIMPKDKVDELRKYLTEYFVYHRRIATGDATRMAWVEVMAREGYSDPNFKSREEAASRYLGGEIVDIIDLHKRLQRELLAKQAIDRAGLQSGGALKHSALKDRAWIVEPTGEWIPYDPEMKGRMVAGGMDVVVNAKLGHKDGEVLIQPQSRQERFLGDRLGAFVYSSFGELSERMMDAKAMLKFHKQSMRAIHHGPVESLGIKARARTGLMAGEYSLYTERRLHVDEDIVKATQEITALKLRPVQQAIPDEAKEAFQDKLKTTKNDLIKLYQERDDLDMRMRQADEHRFHESFFRLARHFREVDDLLTVGATQRAMTSGWGGSAFIDLLNNTGLAVPYTPFIQMRGRLPGGAFLTSPFVVQGMGFSVGYYLSKYVSERMRPFALLASGMPAYSEVQAPRSRDQWGKAFKSLIPFSPESVKFFEVKWPAFRNLTRWKAIEADIDSMGTVGYEHIQKMKAAERELEEALENARDIEKKTIEEELEKQRKLIKEQEKLALARGYMAAVDDDGTLKKGPDGRPVYISLFLKGTDGEGLEVDENGIVRDPAKLIREGAPITPDTEQVIPLRPMIHKSLIGTVPFETLADYFTWFSAPWEKIPGVAPVMRKVNEILEHVPIMPSYYSFDPFEVSPEYHGRSTFLRMEQTYHTPVGQLSLSPLPHFSTSLWGAKPIQHYDPFGLLPARTGEYVEKGLTGASHMWNKYVLSAEQMPLYRMGEEKPVPGVVWYSPFKYIDPSLAVVLTGKYKALATSHEEVVTHPWLADIYRREMPLEALVASRVHELHGFRLWSYAQALGVLMPVIGLRQTAPMALRSLGQDRAAALFESALMATPATQWLAPTEAYKQLPKVREEEEKRAKALTGMFSTTCRRCYKQIARGTFCPHCHTYVAY